MLSRQIGIQGETYAEEYLIKKGFSILDKNYHSRYGEIDIIAADNEYIIFTEVKTRGINTIANPCEFVTKSKQKKIIITAMYYINEKNIKLQPRFDIIEIYF
jgi:putative endonuclease